MGHGSAPLASVLTVNLSNELFEFRFLLRGEDGANLFAAFQARRFVLRPGRLANRLVLLFCLIEYGFELLALLRVEGKLARKTLDGMLSPVSAAASTGKEPPVASELSSESTQDQSQHKNNDQPQHRLTIRVHGLPSTFHHQRYHHLVAVELKRHPRSGQHILAFHSAHRPLSLGRWSDGSRRRYVEINRQDHDGDG